MLKRAWLVISLFWALMEIGAQLANGAAVTLKVIAIAAFPFIAGLVIEIAWRFIVTGSVRKPRVQLYRGPRQ